MAAPSVPVPAVLEPARALIEAEHQRDHLAEARRDRHGGGQHRLHGIRHRAPARVDAVELGRPLDGGVGGDDQAVDLALVNSRVGKRPLQRNRAVAVGIGWNLTAADGLVVGAPVRVPYPDDCGYACGRPLRLHQTNASRLSSLFISCSLISAHSRNTSSLCSPISGAQRMSPGVFDIL